MFSRKQEMKSIYESVTAGVQISLVDMISGIGNVFPFCKKQNVLFRIFCDSVPFIPKEAISKSFVLTGLGKTHQKIESILVVPRKCIPQEYVAAHVGRIGKVARGEAPCHNKLELIGNAVFPAEGNVIIVQKHVRNRQFVVNTDNVIFPKITEMVIKRYDPIEMDHTRDIGHIFFIGPIPSGFTASKPTVFATGSFGGAGGNGPILVIQHGSQVKNVALWGNFYVFRQFAFFAADMVTEKVIPPHGAEPEINRISTNRTIKILVAIGFRTISGKFIDGSTIVGLGLCIKTHFIHSFT